MAMVVIPFAIGILFSEYIVLPLWLYLLLFVTFLLCTLLMRDALRSVSAWLLLMVAGGALHNLSYRGETLYSTPLDLELKVERTTIHRGGYNSTEMSVVECQECDIAGRRVVVWSDSLTSFTMRDRVRLRASIEPFRADRERYARLMSHRGFVGSISLSKYTPIEYIPSTRQSLHDMAVARLSSILEPSDERAVVLAMTTAERGQVSYSLSSLYAKAGISHILAVSGLHIGIVLLLINILLSPLRLMRRAIYLRHLLAVALMWLYVVMCGMPPSAVRAVVMFTVLQLSFMIGERYVSANVLAATAFVMLALNSHLLFDISFQLSFIAVAAILSWAIPLGRVLRTRVGVVNYIVLLLLIGVAATVATLPLVANTFGMVSLVGVALNLVVTTLASVVVCASIVAMALPFVAPLVESAARLINQLAEWAVSLPYSHYEFSLTDGAMYAIYLLYCAVTIAIAVWSHSRGGKVKRVGN